MTELKDIPLSVIQAELERRMREGKIAEELERRTRAATDVPMMVASPDFTVLRQVIARGVEAEVVHQAPDDDFKYYVYEAAMNAVYGDSYFKWRNKQDW